jgi:hypothetical protein
MRVHVKHSSFGQQLRCRGESCASFMKFTFNMNIDQLLVFFIVKVHSLSEGKKKTRPLMHARAQLDNAVYRSTSKERQINENFWEKLQNNASRKCSLLAARSPFRQFDSRRMREYISRSRYSRGNICRRLRADSERAVKGGGRSGARGNA